MTKRGWLLAAIGMSLCLPATAEDWPQWRGPERTGISREIGLLPEWPEAGPKLLWQVKDLGGGYSTPAVVGERIYVMSNRGNDDEFVVALEVKQGKQLWSTRLGKVGPNRGPQYPGARSTPTVEGDVLYALGSDGDLACVETGSGEIRWKKNLRTDFGGRPGNWAYAESPLIDGDALICTPGGSEATLVKLNKNSGDVIWKCHVPDGDEAAYASATIVEVGGVRQYVQFLQKGLVGVEADTGKFLWRYNQTAQGSPANIPTPVAKDEYVYSATGRGGAGLVKLEVNNGQITAKEVYHTRGLPSAIGGAIELDGYLYGTSGAGLICAEFLTGKQKWQERGLGAGAICYADGRLYLHGENGDVALIEATPEGYREKGRFSPPDQPDRGKAQAWAYPVVANGRLYIRDLGLLWCYDIQERSGR